jgi:hypothetical protein
MRLEPDRAAVEELVASARAFSRRAFPAVEGELTFAATAARAGQQRAVCNLLWDFESEMVCELERLLKRVSEGRASP